MKVMTPIVLRSALYTVLLSSSPMLTADGGANPPPTPSQRGGAGSAGATVVRLGDETLDSIVAGQNVQIQSGGIAVATVVNIDLPTQPEHITDNTVLATTD